MFYSASDLSQHSPLPTQVVFVLTFQNQADGQTACDIVGNLPAFPNQINSTAPRQFSAGIK